VLRYKSPDPRDLRCIQPSQHVGALFHAEGDPDLLTALRESGATAWSYEFVAEHGRFPLGRPGGRIAGIQAVLAGAAALQAPRGRGVLLGIAEGAEPASVVVIGSGNVGNAAAEAAAALGATVTVLTRCESSRADYQDRAPARTRVLGWSARLHRPAAGYKVGTKPPSMTKSDPVMLAARSLAR
jgi:alanine dehydrogenase